jgi:hypothetical protein
MIHTLGEIAKSIGAELEGDAGFEIKGVGTLENAETGEISFFSNRRYTVFRLPPWSMTIPTLDMPLPPDYSIPRRKLQQASIRLQI